MTSRTKSNKAKMEKGLKPWLKKVPFATWFENCCFPAGRQHKHGRRHGSYLALSCRSSRPQTSKGHGNFCRNFIDCNAIPQRSQKAKKIPGSQWFSQAARLLSDLFAFIFDHFDVMPLVHLKQLDWDGPVTVLSLQPAIQDLASCSWELQLKVVSTCQRPPSEGWQLMSVVNCDISTEFRSKNYQRWRIVRIHIVYKFQGKCVQRGLWAFLKTPTASPMWLQCRE